MKKKTILKKVLITLIILVLAFLIINPIFIHFNTEHKKNKYANEYPAIEINQIEPGDLIFARATLPWDVVPGYWTHAGIFAGEDDKGSPIVIEATMFTKVHIAKFNEMIQDRKHIMVGKVKQATPEMKKEALDWVKSKLGYDFDYWWPDKQEEGQDFYCTELIWSAYIKQGINLDSYPEPTFKFANGVAPQEIFDSPEIEIFNLIS